MKQVKMSSFFVGDKFKFLNYDNCEYSVISINGIECWYIFNEETKYLSCIPQAYLSKLDVNIKTKPLSASEIYEYDKEDKKKRRDILKNKIDKICRGHEIGDVINVLSSKISEIS